MGATISYLIYMNKIKLYTKSKLVTDQLTDPNYQDLQQQQCNVVSTRAAKWKVSLPNGNIADIEHSNYLGIIQANWNLEEATGKLATVNYLQKVRQVLRSQLNGRNKVGIINICTLPVIIYPAAILN